MRQTERKSEWGRVRGKGRQGIPSRLSAEQGAQYGARSQYPEIMT